MRCTVHIFSFENIKKDGVRIKFQLVRSFHSIFKTKLRVIYGSGKKVSVSSPRDAHAFITSEKQSVTKWILCRVL